MLLKHSAIYSASVILNGLIGFIAIAVNTRLLGVDEYGRYALAFSAAIAVSGLFFEWLRISIMRFYDTEHGPALLSASLSLYALGSAIIAGLGVLLFAINYSTHFPAIGWVGVGLFAVCVAFTDLFIGLARAALRPALFSFMQIMRGVLTLLLGACAAWLHFGFMGVLTGMAVANGLTVIYGFFQQTEWRLLRPCVPDKKSVMTLIQFGCPIVVTIIAMQVLSLLDRYMLSYFHGATEVGAYAAAGDITQKLIVMIATGVNLASYNLMVRAYEKDGLAEAEAKLETTLTVLLSIVLPVAVGIALIAEPMGNLLLGAAVAQHSVQLMPLLSVAAVLQVLRAYYFDQPYHILKITSKIFWPYFAASIVAVISWFILIPTHGAQGAIYGLIVAHMAGLCVSFLGIRKKFKLHVSRKDVTIIVGAVAVMAVMVGLLPWPNNNVWLFIKIATGGISYAAVMVLGDVLGARNLILRKLRVIV